MRDCLFKDQNTIPFKAKPTYMFSLEFQKGAPLWIETFISKQLKANITGAYTGSSAGTLGTLSMKELNVNIKSAQVWTKRLWEVKERYMQMEKRCTNLNSLRKEVQQKEDKLLKLRQNVKECKEQQTIIPSVETMIKLFAHPSKTFRQSSKLYMTYFKQIKSLFKFDKQQQLKRTSKIVKVKEMIDSIREGRKKFNELILIYQSRISKMQEKIGRVKGFNQK